MTESAKGNRFTVNLIQLLVTLPTTHIETTLRRGDRLGPLPCHSGLGSARGLEAVGVTSITAASILILSQFNGHGLASPLEVFPTCDASIAGRPSLIPYFLQPFASCELLILELFLLISLHWYIIFSLFSRGGWKEKHRASVGTIAMAGTVCCGMFVKDQAALFLVVAPLITDLAMLGCWMVNWVMAHG